MRLHAGAGREEDLPAAALNAAAENLQKARADNVKVSESELAQLSELSTRCDPHYNPFWGLSSEAFLMPLAFFPDYNRLSAAGLALCCLACKQACSSRLPVPNKSLGH